MTQLERMLNIVTVKGEDNARVLGFTAGTFDDAYFKVLGKLAKDKETPEFSKDEFIKALNTKVSAPAQADDDKKKFIFNTEKLEEWLAEHKDTWNISNDGKTIVNTIDGFPSEKDIDELATAIASYYLDHDIIVSKDSITTIVKNYVSTAAMRGLADLGKNIAYDSTATLNTDAYLAAIYKFFAISQPRDVFFATMKHWMWLVKRKMRGMSVKNHIWVSLQGGAGLGKSTLVRRLTAPFGGFAVETALGKVLESTKEIKLLTSAYILNMDEIAVNSERSIDGEHALSKDQMNVLKSVLTGDYINARVYGTQEQSRRRITFTVISTSNDHLYDILFDEATMRRYVEFNCMSTTKTNDDFHNFERFTSAERALLAWRGIDENREDGYLLLDTPEFKELRREQATYFPTNRTTWQWAINRANPDEDNLTNKNFLHNFGFEEGASHSMASLYDDYQAFCKEWDCSASSRQRFEGFIAHFVPEYGMSGCNLAAKSAAFDAWVARLKGLNVEQAKKQVIDFPTMDDIHSTPF